MPSDTDRSHVTGATPVSPGSPTAGDTAGHERGPVWPLTALVVLVGWCLLALPALLLVPLGVDLLDGTGDPAKSGYGRGVTWDDVFADATRLDWVLTAVLLVAVAAVVGWRRRRQTGIRVRSLERQRTT